MQISRALIVDDSRTAQHRLKKLLTRYHLEVDLAASAEEALGYLSYRQPSVIFMDHHMEGMDGFEALKIIKANPSTATIPVIMYTSKSDDVYAGQAHALGALDTLSKNLMKAVHIEEVLAKLDIHPVDSDRTLAPEVQPSAAAKSAKAAEMAADLAPSPEKPAQTNTNKPRDTIGLAELKAQIARLFELHIADVRTQSTENTKFIVRRLSNEIKNAANQEKRIDDVPLSVINEEAQAENTKLGVVSNSLLLLILVGLAAISFQIYQSNQHASALVDQYSQLSDLSFQSHLLLDDVVKASETPQPSSDSDQNYNGLLETLSWAMNVDTHFGYKEQALSEKQIVNLQTLTFRLSEAGFRGFVELDIRLGNFCVLQNTGGEWELAPPSTPIEKCKFTKDQDLELSADDYASVPYLQFEQTAAPIKNGQIEFILNVSAYDNPIAPYPTLSSGVTAADWNASALKNQQVVIGFERTGIN